MEILRGELGHWLRTSLNSQTVGLGLQTEWEQVQAKESVAYKQEFDQQFIQTVASNQFALLLIVSITDETGKLNTQSSPL